MTEVKLKPSWERALRLLVRAGEGWTADRTDRTVSDGIGGRPFVWINGCTASALVRRGMAERTSGRRCRPTEAGRRWVAEHPGG